MPNRPDSRDIKRLYFIFHYRVTYTFFKRRELNYLLDKPKSATPHLLFNLLKKLLNLFLQIISLAS